MATGSPSPVKTKRTSSESADGETSELQKLFQACDPDHSGRIDKEELRAVMKQLNGNQDVGDGMLETIYNIMDKNGDGFIDEGEFVEALRVFTQGAPGSKKAKSSFQDFFLQFIQANTLEEESLRIQGRVQINEDTTIDCVRFNSHQLFKSKMTGAGHTDVGVYKKFLYSNVFMKLNVPDYFLNLTTHLSSTNPEEILTALQSVQELLYLPEAFVTQRERLEISLAILQVFDGLTGLSYKHGNNYSELTSYDHSSLQKYLHFPPPTHTLISSYCFTYNTSQSVSYCSLLNVCANRCRTVSDCLYLQSCWKG